MEIKTALKASVAAAALLALTAPVDAVAGGKVSANNSKVDLKIGGRVHRSLVFADDGTREALFHSSGISGNSEIWMTGSGKITESMTMGAYVRWDIPKNGAGYSFGSTSGIEAVTDSATDLDKYEYIYFKTGGNTLSIGDIEPGADGTMDGNYGARAGDDGASLSAIDTTLADGSFSNDEAAGWVGKIDPGGDSNRIRFDSKAMGGLTVHGDFEYGGGGSVGAKWKGTLGGLTVKAGLGYEADGGGTEIKGGHVAVKHASGLHAAVNYGEQDADATDVDPEWRRVVLGYDSKMNSLGNTNISVFISEKEDETAKGNEGEMVSVGIKQSLDSVGGAIVLQIDNYSFENTAAEDLQDVDTIILETSFNF